MKQRLLILCLLGLMTLIPAAGCQLAAFVMPRETTYDVKAQYLGLENKSVAVIVAADEFTLYRYPRARYFTSAAVSSAIQAAVPGVSLVDPRQITAFQEQQPYWTTMPYSQLANALGVERLIVIDLADYSTHEPGNMHIWRGVMSGNVAVIEADAADPDDITVSFDIAVQFPETGAVGLLDESDETMQLGMLKLFARNTARLFHDHEVKM